jgi:RHH-type proline utilization regulon transcriptional repressor/proline dehydrogenase/delta 1-pyrroline-5-carboxylate dehydrogenase
LHVLRYRRAQLGALISALNGLGYGLTLGIHSRIDETIDYIVARARVGNIYVNRNMIGAVVGVQPFGGEGLSGTGPKAGGPLYLERLRRATVAALDLGPLGATVGEAPPLPALAALRRWADNEGHSALARRCDEYARATPLAWRFELPGPTGESNRETFHPRGRAYCPAAALQDLLEQLAAAFATGNRVVLPAAAMRLLAPTLARALETEIDAGDAAEVDVALASDEAAAADLRRALAARDGKRVRVVTPVGGAYPLHWLVVERAVSVNTAAAGGNATLMTLDPA